MARFLIRRFLYSVLVMWLVTTFVFWLVYVMPENPARKLAGRQATPAVIEAIKDKLGLEDPFHVQYGRFIWDLLHGNLGFSYYTHQPVTDYLMSLVPRTASLVLGASVIWLVVGLAIGILSSTRPRTLLDRGATTFALGGLSTPTFLLGLLLLFFFFFKLNTVFGIEFFPPGGYVPLSENPLQWARHLLLPWITLAMVQAAVYTRLSRGSMLEVLGEDYIRTARAKGLGERRVIYRHGLRSAMTPVMSQFGVDVGQLMGGVLITESVFGIGGLGQAAVRATVNSDIPVIMGVVLVLSAFVVTANLIVDAMYGVLDPRVRVS